MKAVDFLKGMWAALRPQYRIYRFDVYDGTERSVDIDNTNVVGYRFINQGTNGVEINGGLFVPPAAPFGTTQLPSTDTDVSTKNYPNEIDTTIYKIKFIQTDPVDPGTNRLVVVSKCRSIKRPEQFEQLVTSEEISEN